MKTLSLFVDTHNLYLSVRQQFKRRKLDYSKYVGTFSDDVIYKALAYGFFVEKEAKKFISCLHLMGFEPKYKKRIPDQLFENDWDLEIMLDIIKLIDKSDVIVIGSSHKKFVPVVQWIKEQDTECVIFSSNIPTELKEAASSYVEITEDMLEDIKT